MSYRPSSKAIVLTVLFASFLSGCSDIYYDRRETISVVSGEAMAANRVTHMIDPWPAVSGRREIAYSGERMQMAHERYRTGCITKPINATTSSTGYAQDAQQTQCQNSRNTTSAPVQQQVK
jgi:hypothetical protein